MEIIILKLFNDYDFLREKQKVRLAAYNRNHLVQFMLLL